MATCTCPASSELGKATWRGGASPGPVKAMCACLVPAQYHLHQHISGETHGVALPPCGRKGEDIWGCTRASLGELMGWPCWDLQARAQLPQGLLSDHCDSKLRGWSWELCLWLPNSLQIKTAIHTDAWSVGALFLPRESHGQRSLVGYSRGGHTVKHD